MFDKSRVNNKRIQGEMLQCSTLLTLMGTFTVNSLKIMYKALQLYIFSLTFSLSISIPSLSQMAPLNAAYQFIGNRIQTRLMLTPPPVIV
jgi:hypothetical protein